MRPKQVNVRFSEDAKKEIEKIAKELSIATGSIVDISKVIRYCTLKELIKNDDLKNINSDESKKFLKMLEFYEAEVDLCGLAINIKKYIDELN